MVAHPQNAKQGNLKDAARLKTHRVTVTVTVTLSLTLSQSESAGGSRDTRGIWVINLNSLN